MKKLKRVVLFMRKGVIIFMAFQMKSTGAFVMTSYFSLHKDNVFHI
jgi:hypothetical protein